MVDESPKILGSPLEDPGTWQQLQELFAESLEIRRDLLASDSIDEICEASFAFVREAVPTQSVALYLFDKAGYLSRRALAGFDAEGNPIPTGWFPDEKYRPGESFTGRAVLCTPGKSFALPTWTNDIGSEAIFENSRKRYQILLGRLRGVVAIPLNGYHRSYGVLELLNKQDRNGADLDADFTDLDVMKLFLVATSMASAISALRRRQEFQILSELGGIFLSFDQEGQYDNAVFDRTAQQLVGELMPYSAAVIRVADQADRLQVTARSGNNIDWDTWIDLPDDVPPTTMMRVFTTGERMLVHNVSESNIQFINHEWLRANGVETYACFPLKGRQAVLGTLSVCTRYRHEFSANDERFLQSVASLLASIVDSSNVLRELDDARYSLWSVAHDNLGNASKAGYDASLSEVETQQHRLKNDLINIHTLLQEALDASGGRVGIIRKIIAHLDSRIGALETDLSDGARRSDREPIDINELIKAVVAIEKRGATSRQGKQPIHFDTQLMDDSPIISVDPKEMRVVLENLLQNAVRAIQHSKVRVGQICVSTGYALHKGIRYLEIAVEDNGIGVPNENKDKIFEKHFSTYDRGTGMGLYTVKQAVSRSYDGMVLVESKIKGGARFRVLLPLSALQF